MGLAAQTANEWRFWPEREDVTLRSLRSSPGTASAAYDDHRLAYSPGGAVKRRSLKWAEQQASAGAYVALDRVFLLPAANLPANVLPKSGDVVRAVDHDWTVLEVQAGKFANTHRCVCRSIVLVYGLRDLATVRRPAPAPSSGGLRAANLADLYSGVPCRLQPDGWTAEDEMAGGVKTNSTYLLYLGRPYVLAAGDVVSAGGVVYEVRGQSELSRLDRLSTTRVERVS